jgi:hypothetical protein
LFVINCFNDLKEERVERGERVGEWESGRVGEWWTLPLSRSPALPLSRSPTLPLSRSPTLPLFFLTDDIQIGDMDLSDWHLRLNGLWVNFTWRVVGLDLIEVLRLIREFE